MPLVTAGQFLKALEPTSDSPRIDLELLLAHVMGVDRNQIRSLYAIDLSNLKLDYLQELIGRRLQGEPIAYLIGTQEFYLDTFMVNPSVLIPRPETELLVDLVKTAVGRLNLATTMGSDLHILDLGTGSGAVGLSLAGLFKSAHVHLTDVSDEALAVAKHNAVNLQRSNTKFFNGSWFNAVPCGTRYDFIVSNPPYLMDDDPKAEANVLKYEPRLALTSGPLGLDAIESIIKSAPNYLKSNGILWLEHGLGQAESVRSLLEERGFSDIKSHQDLAGIERVSGGVWTGSINVA